MRIVSAIASNGAERIRPDLRDKFIVVSRNEGDAHELDLEIGYSLLRESNASVTLAGGIVLQAGTLPAVETMATVVRTGTDADSHAPFGAIGTWIEANDFKIVGPCREVFLESSSRPNGSDEPLIEIQFPVIATA